MHMHMVFRCKGKSKKTNLRAFFSIFIEKHKRGCSGGIQTRDLLRSRQLLYQLSHRGSSAGWVQITQVMQDNASKTKHLIIPESTNLLPFFVTRSLFLSRWLPYTPFTGPTPHRFLLSPLLTPPPSLPPSSLPPPSLPPTSLPLPSLPLPFLPLPSLPPLLLYLGPVILGVLQCNGYQLHVQFTLLLPTQ